MILHGGQSNIDNQLIGCEIKRKDKRYPSQKKICDDFEKLDGYLQLTLPNIDSILDAHYQRAVFIMVNTTKEELKELVAKSLKSSSKLDSLKANADKIYCVSYNPSIYSKKGEIDPESFKLSDILTKL